MCFFFFFFFLCDLELCMTQFTLYYQLSKPQTEDKNHKKTLSLFMIIILIIQPPLSLLSHYSNLPHSVSLSMVFRFKLKPYFYLQRYKRLSRSIAHTVNSTEN